MNSQCFMCLYTFILVLSSHWLQVWKQLNERRLWLCWYECSCSLLPNAVYTLGVNVIISFNLCLHVVNDVSVIYMYKQPSNASRIQHKHIIIYVKGKGLRRKQSNTMFLLFFEINRWLYAITRWCLLKEYSTEHLSIISHSVSRGDSQKFAAS